MDYLSAGELFDDVIIHNKIPITSMPPVQQTTLFASIKEDKIVYVKNAKREVITAALFELDTAKVRCVIPSKEDLINTMKGYPIEWDAIYNIKKV